jgi:hypothetical protein
MKRLFVIFSLFFFIGTFRLAYAEETFKIRDYWPLAIGDEWLYDIDATNTGMGAFSFNSYVHTGGTTTVNYPYSTPQTGYIRYESQMDGHVDYDVSRITSNGFETIMNYEATNKNYDVYGPYQGTTLAPYVQVANKVDMNSSWNVNYDLYQYNKSGAVVSSWQNKETDTISDPGTVSVKAGTFHDVVQVHIDEVRTSDDGQTINTYYEDIYLAKGVGKIASNSVETITNSAGTVLSTQTKEVELQRAVIDGYAIGKPQYPIVLVSGVNLSEKDAADYWKPTVQYFDSLGWTNGGTVDVNIVGSTVNDVALSGTMHLTKGDYYLVNFESWREAVVQQADGLRDYINTIEQITGAPKVTLLGHSMGGDISREVLGPDIDSLITLGTPYRGSAFATLGKVLNPSDEALRDISIGSVFLEGGNENSVTSLNQDVNCNNHPGDNITGQLTKAPPATTRVVSIVENAWDPTSFATSPHQIGGDGVVSAESQKFTLKYYDSNGNPVYDVYGSLIGSDYAHMSQSADLYSIMMALGYRPPLVFNGHSPIDFLITDPEGNYISKDGSSILGAVYSEIDFDGDGDFEPQVIIPSYLEGNYRVQVFPQDGAPLSDIFSLSVLFNGQRTFLANGIMLQDIPQTPYNFNANPVPEPATILLFGLGGVGMAFRRFRQKNA